MEPVRVAAVQAAPVLLDRDATVERVIDLSEKAAAEGAGLVVLAAWIAISVPLALVMGPVLHATTSGRLPTGPLERGRH